MSARPRRQRLGANRESLVCGANRRQPPPGDGALAIALSEPALDIGAAAVGLGELLIHRFAGIPGFACPALGRRELCLVEAKLRRQQPAPQLGRLALQARVNVRGLGLALERSQAAARLTLDIECPIEVLLGAARA